MIFSLRFYEKLLYFPKLKCGEECFIVLQSSSMSRKWKTTGFSYLLLCAIWCSNVLVELYEDNPTTHVF